MDVLINIIFWMAGTLVFLLTVGLIFHQAVKSSNKKQPSVTLKVAPENSTAVERISDLPWSYVSDALMRRDESDIPTSDNERMQLQDSDQ